MRTEIVLDPESGRFAITLNGPRARRAPRWLQISMRALGRGEVDDSAFGGKAILGEMRSAQLATNTVINLSEKSPSSKGPSRCDGARAAQSPHGRHP